MDLISGLKIVTVAPVCSARYLSSLGIRLRLVSMVVKSGKGKIYRFLVDVRDTFAFYAKYFYLYCLGFTTALLKVCGQRYI